MKVLCKIGLHRFKPFAHNSLVNPLPVEECARCGIGRQLSPYGYETRYTREAIIEAKAQLERLPSTTPTIKGEK